MTLLRNSKETLRYWALPLLSAALLAGCSQSANDAAVGSTAAEAIIHSPNGRAVEGSFLGATAGTSAGATTGPSTDAPKANEEEEKSFMIRQAEKMKKQQDELDDLRRQRYHDEYLRQQYDVGN